MIEVKHWPANDYKGIHAQATSYFTKGVKAFACVMIAHHQKQGWKDEYSAACLDGQVEGHTWQLAEPPLGGRFLVQDARGPVVHFLLQLAKR